MAPCLIGFLAWPMGRTICEGAAATRFGAPVSQTCDGVQVIFAWAASVGRYWAIGGRIILWYEVCSFWESRQGARGGNRTKPRIAWKEGKSHAVN